MSLQDWLQNGWLRKHDTSQEEIADLLGLVARDLSQCRKPGLIADWRLSIAYNAALQAATAALAAAGFRVERGQSHHSRTIQSLEYTIGADRQLVAEFDVFRTKRNLAGYDRAGTVSEQEADEMLELARRLAEQVEEWIRTEHPELV
jgi:HAMP domain-containing protein